MNRIKKTKIIIVVSVTILTVIFLIKALLEYYNQIKDSSLSIPVYFFLIVFIFHLGYFYMRALSWKSMINFLGESASKERGLSIWFLSEATRYFPGNIWSFASRVYLARQNHLSSNLATLILPIEIIIVVVTTTLLSSYAIIKNLGTLPVESRIFIPIIAFLAISFVLLLFHTRIKQLFKKIFELNLNLNALTSVIIFQLLGWSLYSFATIILVLGFVKVDNYLLLFSTTILAWLIGYLSFITPMGLGVREGTFVLLMGTEIGINQAIFIALLSRLILIAAEIINLLFWVIAKRKHISF